MEEQSKSEFTAVCSTVKTSKKNPHVLTHYSFSTSPSVYNTIGAKTKRVRMTALKTVTSIRATRTQKKAVNDRDVHHKHQPQFHSAVKPGPRWNVLRANK